MPLHRLQTHPPGLPHLCQGKWGPQDTRALLLKQRHSGITAGRDAKGLWMREKRDNMARWQVVPQWIPSVGHGLCHSYSERGSHQQHGDFFPGRTWATGSWNAQELTSSRAFRLGRRPWTLARSARDIGVVACNNNPAQLITQALPPFPSRLPSAVGALLGF